MTVRVVAVGRPEVPVILMPERFRHEVAFFMTPGDEPGAPVLARDEYWVRQIDAKQCLDDCMIRVVSPLDSQNRTEIELSEDQEDWLTWLVEHGVEHVRLERIA